MQNYNRIKEFTIRKIGSDKMSTKSLAEIRQEKGITQAKMAELLGISVAAYNLYENGGRKIPFKVAEKISEILGINKDDFFSPVSFALRKTNTDQMQNNAQSA